MNQSKLPSKDAKLTDEQLDEMAEQQEMNFEAREVEAEMKQYEAEQRAEAKKQKKNPALKDVVKTIEISDKVLEGYKRQLRKDHRKQDDDVQVQIRKVNFGGVSIELIGEMDRDDKKPHFRSFLYIDGYLTDTDGFDFDIEGDWGLYEHNGKRYTLKVVVVKGNAQTTAQISAIKRRISSREKKINAQYDKIPPITKKIQEYRELFEAAKKDFKCESFELDLLLKAQREDEKKLKKLMQGK